MRERRFVYCEMRVSAAAPERQAPSLHLRVLGGHDHHRVVASGCPPPPPPYGTMADPYPGTLHDYFPRASGSNLLPVSPRRPHPPLSHAHADPYASSLAPRTEPYMPQFDVPKYLRHASLFKDRFATEVPPEEPSSSSSSSLSTSRFKGKAKQSSLGPPQGSVSSGVTTGGKTTAGPTGDPILLPTGWNPGDRCALLDLTSDALGVSFAGSAKNGDRDAAAVRANRPVPSQAGVYYFEVKILDKGVSGYIGQSAVLLTLRPTRDRPRMRPPDRAAKSPPKQESDFASAPSRSRGFQDGVSALPLRRLHIGD